VHFRCINALEAGRDTGGSGSVVLMQNWLAMHLSIIKGSGWLKWLIRIRLKEKWAIKLYPDGITI
jgi:hypothetical protein